MAERQNRYTQLLEAIFARHYQEGVTEVLFERAEISEVAEVLGIIAASPDSLDKPLQAIVESAVRRFRPIVLTAAAAVLAMIPLSRSVFWGPMAVAIMGGLIVATALTLLALPAMYAAWFRVKRESGPGSA